MILGQTAIGTGGDDHGHGGAPQNGRHPGTCKKGQGLVKDIARFDVREDQYVGLPFDGRMNMFVMATRDIASRLHIHRTVHDRIAVNAFGGTLLQRHVIQRMRELRMLFLGKMNQGYPLTQIGRASCRERV